MKVICGDVNEVLPCLDVESFDGVLCDPPYGLSFMGKAWDHGVPSADTWALVARVLKPGASLLAFGGTRTFHRLTCAIEGAGFEIRDCLAWLYGQGFPKSHNLKGAFQGYGTALKPAWEPCILAMKPTAGTFAENALAHGVAGLNVDGCRIGTTKDIPASVSKKAPSNCYGRFRENGEVQGIGGHDPNTGRWPANVMLDEDAAAMLGEPSRFFYVAKASRSEREAGLEGFEKRNQPSTIGDLESIEGNPRKPSTGHVPRIANHHPTVKPLAVCEWLARLILPPRRDTPRRLLVPFSGSGSEMIGALLAGWDEVVGIELNPEYVEIAEARIRHHLGLFS